MPAPWRYSTASQIKDCRKFLATFEGDYDLSRHVVTQKRVALRPEGDAPPSVQERAPRRGHGNAELRRHLFYRSALEET